MHKANGVEYCYVRIILHKNTTKKLQETQ